MKLASAAVVVVAALGLVGCGSGLPSAQPSGGVLPSGLFPRPARSAAASEPSAPPTPTPTEAPAPSLTGEYAGVLVYDQSCFILFAGGDEHYELVLPRGHRTKEVAGRQAIVNRRGNVVAGEGDLIGLEGDVRSGGSSCMLAPQLHVSEVVDVVPRDP